MTHVHTKLLSDPLSRVLEYVCHLLHKPSDHYPPELLIPSPQVLICLLRLMHVLHVLAIIHRSDVPAGIVSAVEDVSDLMKRFNVFDSKLRRNLREISGSQVALDLGVCGGGLESGLVGLEGRTGLGDKNQVLVLVVHEDRDRLEAERECRLVGKVWRE